MGLRTDSESLGTPHDFTGVNTETVAVVDRSLVVRSYPFRSGIMALPAEIDRHVRCILLDHNFLL